MGAQARQASRTEFAASRLYEHFIHYANRASCLNRYRRVRYVITLDADTRLPRGAAARLVGTMAHPLNQPDIQCERRAASSMATASFNPESRHRCPRIERDRSSKELFPGPAESIPILRQFRTCTRIFFAKGSYTGKGIYDLDVFEAALAGKVPDNILLSHDLFEGIFARTALATDIELFDEFPSHYEAAAARQHRWARGDWQLLPWIVSGTAGPPGGRKFKIPIIGRWKMLDNLRRSLSAPCMFLLLVIAWLVPHMSPLAVGSIRARNDCDSRADSVSLPESIRALREFPSETISAELFPICRWAYGKRD